MARVKKDFVVQALRKAGFDVNVKYELIQGMFLPNSIYTCIYATKTINTSTDEDLLWRGKVHTYRLTWFNDELSFANKMKLFENQDFVNVKAKVWTEPNINDLVLQWMNNELKEN